MKIMRDAMDVVSDGVHMLANGFQLALEHRGRRRRQLLHFAERETDDGQPLADVVVQLARDALAFGFLAKYQTSLHLETGLFTIGDVEGRAEKCRSALVLDE